MLRFKYFPYVTLVTKSQFLLIEFCFQQIKKDYELLFFQNRR